jgi:hypothetical protein
MGHLKPDHKKAARKALAMYLGTPPYDVEEARRLIASGLLEEPSMKYGFTPVELIREISDIVLTEKQRREARRELTEYFGKPIRSGEEIRRRPSSVMLERKILAKYLMTLKELMSEAGFQTKRPRRGWVVQNGA